MLASGAGSRAKLARMACANQTRSMALIQMPEDLRAKTRKKLHRIARARLRFNLKDNWVPLTVDGSNTTNNQIDALDRLERLPVRIRRKHKARFGYSEYSPKETGHTEPETHHPDPAKWKYKWELAPRATYTDAPFERPTEILLRVLLHLAEDEAPLPTYRSLYELMKPFGIFRGTKDFKRAVRRLRKVGLVRINYAHNPVRRTSLTTSKYARISLKPEMLETARSMRDAANKYFAEKEAADEAYETLRMALINEQEDEENPEYDEEDIDVKLMENIVLFRSPLDPQHAPYQVLTSIDTQRTSILGEPDEVRARMEAFVAEQMLLDSRAEMSAKRPEEFLSPGEDIERHDLNDLAKIPFRVQRMRRVRDLVESFQTDGLDPAQVEASPLGGFSNVEEAKEFLERFQREHPYAARKLQEMQALAQKRMESTANIDMDALDEESQKKMREVHGA